MIVEGKGMCAPAPVRTVLTMADRRVLLEECYRRAEFRQYQHRSDSWGQGLVEGREVAGLGFVPRDVIGVLVGMVGEYGVAQYLRRVRPSWDIRIDTALRGKGDGGIDIVAYGMKLQIKTKQSKDGGNLIKVAPSYPWHAACFCHWNMVDIVHFLGWSWKSEVVDREQSLPRIQNATWRNYEVDDLELHAPASLLAEVEAWKGANQCL